MFECIFVCFLICLLSLIVCQLFLSSTRELKRCVPTIGLSLFLPLSHVSNGFFCPLQCNLTPFLGAYLAVGGTRPPIHVCVYI